MQFSEKYWPNNRLMSSPHLRSRTPFWEILDPQLSRVGRGAGGFKYHSASENIKRNPTSGLRNSGSSWTCLMSVPKSDRGNEICREFQFDGKTRKIFTISQKYFILFFYSFFSFTVTAQCKICNPSKLFQCKGKIWIAPAISMSQQPNCLETTELVRGTLGFIAFYKNIIFAYFRELSTTTKISLFFFIFIFFENFIKRFWNPKKRPLPVTYNPCQNGFPSNEVFSRGALLTVINVW